MKRKGGEAWRWRRLSEREKREREKEKKRKKELYREMIPNKNDGQKKRRQMKLITAKKNIRGQIPAFKAKASYEKKGKQQGILQFPAYKKGLQTTASVQMTTLWTEPESLSSRTEKGRQNLALEMKRRPCTQSLITTRTVAYLKKNPNSSKLETMRELKKEAQQKGEPLDQEKLREISKTFDQVKHLKDRASVRTIPQRKPTKANPVCSAKAVVTQPIKRTLLNELLKQVKDTEQQRGSRLITEKELLIKFYPDIPFDKPQYGPNGTRTIERRKERPVQSCIILTGQSGGKPPVPRKKQM